MSEHTMAPEDFHEDEVVFHEIDKLHKHIQRKNKQFSDVTDNEGLQYIDLVLEGGGVLGIALVGYTYALEEAGLRILRVGGTSAGAINALFIAALGTPDQPKSKKMIDLIANMNMWDFVDGDSDAKDFVEAMVAKSGLIKLGWKGWQILDNLTEDLGLNPGKKFFQWVKGALDKEGIHSNAALLKRMRTLPGNLKAKNRPYRPSPAKRNIAIVAAEVTTETKVIFPEMASLFWKDPHDVHPAHFVRASMSIPYFFHPYHVQSIPKGTEAAKHWAKHAGYKGRIPSESIFVDGGIISNFPINLFHGKGVPVMPTFGVKLGRERINPKKINNPLQLGGAIFDTARHAADFDFILRNRDYKKLVKHIDTGDHHWLNFSMNPDQKRDLFVLGVKAGVEFLMKFDWEEYKQIRAEIHKGESKKK